MAFDESNWASADVRLQLAVGDGGYNLEWNSRRPATIPPFARPTTYYAACCCQPRSKMRINAGYTSAYRNGLIAAMYALPNSPFGLTSTAI